MANKPSTYLNWTDGNGTKITQPPAAQLLSGWTAGEPMPFQYLNWLFYETDQWIQYLDNQLNDDVSIFNLDQTMRLINGGTWSWNLGTGVLAWSSAFNLAIPSIVDADNQAAAGNVTLTDGQVAYVAANVPFTTACATTNGSPVITVAYSTGIVVGQTVTGTGIPGSTTVSSISGTSVTLSANATATNPASNLTFSGIGALTVSVATSSALLPAANTVIIARRVGAVVYVGVNASQMLMHDGEARILMEFGYIGIYRGTAGESLTAGQVVYISPGTGVDSGRTAGSVYKADPGATNGAVRSAWVGFVMTAASSLASVQIVQSGLVTGLSSLTVGALYYADPVTPGGITLTKPTTSGQYVAPVGVALTATTLWMNSALCADTNVVTTPNAYPNYFCATEADLTTAITNATSNGGGVICLLNSFTCTAAHTIPANTVLLGRKGGSILTFSSSGALTLSASCKMLDVQITTALTSGNLVTINGNKCEIAGCQFTVGAAGTGIAVDVNANQCNIHDSTFYGVLTPSTGTGIQYELGTTDNFDEYNEFLP